MTRSLTLLGATGSIGASTLDLVRRNLVSSAEARNKAANKDAFPG
jgi:1-deoxy-D-xylulose 5-phosphate reductoisomerase